LLSLTRLSSSTAEPLSGFRDFYVAVVAGLRDRLQSLLRVPEVSLEKPARFVSLAADSEFYSLTDG
jgi:hypothetical protein